MKMCLCPAFIFMGKDTREAPRREGSLICSLWGVQKAASQSVPALKGDQAGPSKGMWNIHILLVFCIPTEVGELTFCNLSKPSNNLHWTSIGKATSSSHLFSLSCCLEGASQVSQSKESTCQCRRQLERCPEEGNGNLYQYCLRNSMDRGAWRAIGHGVTKELDMTECLSNDNCPEEVARDSLRFSFILCG